MGIDAFDIATGKLLWHADASPGLDRINLFEGRIYFPSVYTLVIIDGTTGELLVEQLVDGYIATVTAVPGGVLLRANGEALDRVDFSYVRALQVTADSSPRHAPIPRAGLAWVGMAVAIAVAGRRRLTRRGFSGSRFLGAFL